MAFSILLINPRRSICSMLITIAPAWRKFFFSPSSISRAPIIATLAGSMTGVGSSQSWTNSGAPRPHSAASGIPWILPDGVVSAVLKSAWASTHSTPIFFPLAAPRMDPSESEWSPPSTSGRFPLFTLVATAPATRRAIGTMQSKYLRLGSLITHVSEMGTSTLPLSSTIWPSFSKRSFSNAYRMALGPISTPRRSAPMSTGTPMMSIFIISCRDVKSPLPEGEGGG